MEWALQFCLLFLTDMPGPTLELLLPNYVPEGNAGITAHLQAIPPASQE